MEEPVNMFDPDEGTVRAGKKRKGRGAIGGEFLPVPSQLERTLQLFFFCIFFWRARVCRPLLRLCRPFMIFEGCLDSNPEYCNYNFARDGR